jgi:pimeloyl-ACP methyl ester carboxylesterase
MKVNTVLALVAFLAVGTALGKLHEAGEGTLVTAADVEGTPVTIYRPTGHPAGPVVLVAHGFAGSQQLMQSFALTFARNGYIAVTFDFLGHGRNPAPLTGSITDPDGATRALVSQTTRIAEYARGLGDGRLAVLGHSMASDIVVRFAQSSPDVAATIAVSMFSPAVTATTPRNLLVIVGDWESLLKREALRAVGLATAPAAPQAGVTYGDTAQGTGRRAAFSPHVEHVSVLFSEDSMREALGWLDQAFGITRTKPPVLDGRGPWILLLIAGVVLLARPASTLLPRVAVPAVGAGLEWRRLWIPLLVPMLGTPLLLRVLPTHFLPVLVGDYLAAHFAMYGLITALCLIWLRRSGAAAGRSAVPKVPTASTATPATGLALATASVAVIAYGFVGLVWPIDEYFTSFVPGRERLILVLAMLIGTLAYFLSDEWLTRGSGGARGAYVASKVAFLISLAIAVALDLERLFFLIIIVPVIVLFFLVYGLFSRWSYARTGHPFVAGFANAVAFAWAIGVTFPLLAG